MNVRMTSSVAVDVLSKTTIGEESASGVVVVIDMEGVVVAEL